MPLLPTPKWGAKGKSKGKDEGRQGMARERSRSRDAPLARRPAAEVDDEDEHEDEHAEEDEHEYEHEDEHAGHRFDFFRPSVVPTEIIQACDRLPIGTTRMTREFADGTVKTIVVTVTEWPPEDL